MTLTWHIVHCQNAWVFLCYPYVRQSLCPCVRPLSSFSFVFDMTTFYCGFCCCCWNLPSFVDQIHLAIVVLANSVGGPMIGSVANKKHILDVRLNAVEPDEMLLKQWIYHVFGNFDWRLPLFPWQLFGKLICPLVSEWQWDKCLLSVVGAEQGHWTIAIFLGIIGQTKKLWIDKR